MLVDVVADGVHDGLVVPDDADAAIAVLHPVRLAAGGDLRLGGIQRGAVIANEALVGAFGIAIPVSCVLPGGKEARFVDLALLRDDEIRIHEDAVLGEALQRLAEAAASVDDPGSPLRAQHLDHLAEAGVIHGITLWMHQSAIEVEAENEAVFGGGHARDGKGRHSWRGCPQPQGRHALTRAAG